MVCLFAPPDKHGSAQTPVWKTAQLLGQGGFQRTPHCLAGIRTPAIKQTSFLPGEWKAKGTPKKQKTTKRGTSSGEDFWGTISGNYFWGTISCDPRLQKVQQATGRGDQNLHPPPQVRRLKGKLPAAGGEKRGAFGRGQSTFES